MQPTVLTEEEKYEFDNIITHPLQSWSWGEFKKSMGAVPERIGFYENGKLVAGVQIIFSKVLKTNFTVGYAAKCTYIQDDDIYILTQLAKKHNAIFIKLEPNYYLPVDNANNTEKSDEILQKNNLLLSNKIIPAKALFTHYDFHLDISRTEEELMSSFHSKTRYNIRLAERKGVKIIDNTTKDGIRNYIRLMEETTKRQKFFNHNAEYFYKIFEEFPKNQLRIFEAVYNDEVLTSWLLFTFKNKLYYPYGASSNSHRELMPNNLIMWKAIQYGKEKKCTTFDLWGCLGPDADPSDPWYGFHKFKSGYNPQLVEHVGAYDFIHKPITYRVFKIADKIRWKLLKLKKRN